MLFRGIGGFRIFRAATRTRPSASLVAATKTRFTDGCREYGIKTPSKWRRTNGSPSPMSWHRVSRRPSVKGRTLNSASPATRSMAGPYLQRRSRNAEASKSVKTRDASRATLRTRASERIPSSRLCSDTYDDGRGVVAASCGHGSINDGFSASRHIATHEELKNFNFT